MKVSACLRGVPDSLNRKTVYISTYDHGKRKFYATTIRLEAKYWQKKVVGHPDSKNLNERIKALILRYEQGQEKPEISFHHYALKCLSEWEHTKRESTNSHLQARIAKFKRFTDCRISSITPELLTRYVNHCYSLGNQSNTVWTALKAIRVIINKAYKEKLIADNPFQSFTMPKYRDPARTYLTRSQVGDVEKFVLGKKCPKSYRIAGGWFLIGCYTGLRLGDQIAFHKSKIRDGRLIIYTSKTGQVVSIKVNDKLKELFKLVDYKPMPYSQQHYNMLLKSIAGICEITEHISPHTARHTFGTLCASAGISQEVTAKLMGHQSLRMTGIYYQITGTRIDSEIDKIF